MKEMLKALILSKRSVNTVINEEKLLSQLSNPFIANMSYAFQDKEYLYLVLDLLSGGDLRYHMNNRKSFSETEASNKIIIFKLEFIISCIIIGLEYLHTSGVLHRNIMPENLVIDERGFLRITDFRLARFWTPENSQDTSGFPGYMGITQCLIIIINIAPEVICRQNHGIAVDYFAVGVIAYELMMGKVNLNNK